MKTYDTDPQLKEEIDKHLEKINSIQATLGTDSTPEERTKAREKQRYRMNKIKELDVKFWAEIRGFELE